MALLADWQIRNLAHEGMITPFSEGSRGRKVSYGLTSYGYDVRLSSEFKIFRPAAGLVIDPLDFDPRLFEEVIPTDGSIIIPPNSFALGLSLERFAIPRWIKAVCTGKSTYARCGIVVNVTPLEPEWEGYITIEISNTSPAPAKVYAEQGIMQVEFHSNPENVCEQSYADKRGRYQGQTNITPPRASN